MVNQHPLGSPNCIGAAHYQHPLSSSNGLGSPAYSYGIIAANPTTLVNQYSARASKTSSVNNLLTLSVNSRSLTPILRSMYTGHCTYPFKCHHCDLWFESQDRTEKHLRGEQHRTNLIKERSVWLWKSARSLEPLIEQLDCDAWKDRIYAHLYREAFAALTIGGEHLLKAKQLLTHYQLVEQTSLLELAAWKAVCILQSVNIPVKYHAWKAWEKEGWKASKQAMRNVSEIGIIVQCVLPFLMEIERSKEENESNNNSAKKHGK